MRASIRRSFIRREAACGSLTALWRGSVNREDGGEGIRNQIVAAAPELLAKANLDRSTLRGVGIGFGYASMPMLIMRSVPPSETGASNGLNALFRSLGTSTAAAVVAAVLATFATAQGGAQVPTPWAFQLSFILGGIGAVAAFAVGLFIPRGHAPQERHPSLPE